MERFQAQPIWEIPAKRKHADRRPRFTRTSALASVAMSFGMLMLTCTNGVRGASFQGVGDLPGGSFSSFANDVSGDGSVVVGGTHTGPELQPYTEAFRWTFDDGMVGLGDLPGGEIASSALGVSADGSVIVGNSQSDFSPSEAYRWTSSGGMVGLGDLPDGGISSFAWDVSADGSVVVGRGTSEFGSEAFRWTSEGGMIGLGDLA